jgi:DNA polymerase III sliding clamp (beta) subunit (PCNA family)
MKFEAKRSPLAQVVSTLSHAMVPSKNPSDTGGYIRVELDKAGINLSVSRHDLFVKVAIDKDAVEKSIITPKREGMAVLEGSVMSAFLNRLKEPEVEAEFKKAPASEKSEDEESGPVEVGRLAWSYRGSKGKRSSTFPCIELAISEPDLFSIPVKATIYGKDFASMVRLVGVATGDASENDKYTCALVRTGEQKVEMITANGQQLGWAKYDGEVSAPMECVVPYSLLQTASKMLNPNGKIKVTSTDESPARIVLTQDVTWADNVIGRIAIRLNTTGEDFFKFEDKLGRLDFKTGCSFKTQQAKDAIDLIDILDRARTTLVFNPEEKLIEFMKVDTHGEVSSELPIDKAKGGKMQIDVSSKHLKVAIDNTPDEEMEVSFSGPRSMAMIRVSSNMSMYFMPYVD